MKKLFTLLAVAAIASSDLWSQAPGLINYQAVARDGAGAIMANATINVTFLIHSGSSAGTVVYEEDHTAVSTNQFGLFSLMIGAGSVVTGTFGALDWAGDSHWLEVEVNGASIGSQQLVSVPYALHAGGPWKQSGGNVYYNDGSVGIGTSTPSQLFHVYGGYARIEPNFGVAGSNLEVSTIGGGYTQLYLNDGASNTVALRSNGSSYVNGGYFGVGTTAPSVPLDVVSTAGYIANFDGGSGMYVAIHEGGAYRGYWGSYSGAAEDVDIGTGGSNATGKLHLTLQATPAVTIAPGQLVGIGTASPAYTLDILNDVAARTVNIVNTAAGSIGQFINIERTNIPSSSNDFFQLVVPSGSPDDFQFIELQRGSTIEWSVEGDGKTSIGASNPAADLHIKQSDGLPSSGTGGIIFEDDNTSDSWHVGIANTDNFWFSFNGTLQSYIQTNGTYTVSDARLKTDVRELGTTLGKVGQIRPLTYRYITSTTDAPTIGVFAQELRQVYPELVSDEDGTLGVNYGALSVVAIKAIQEQQQQIEAQQAQIEALKAEIEALKLLIKR